MTGPIEQESGLPRPGEASIAAAIDDARLVPSPPEDEDTRKLNLTLSGQVRNDIGNAERLAARKGDDLRFVKDAGWYAWTGTHWSLADGDRRAQLAAQETAIAIFAEANATRDAGPRKDSAGNPAETPDEHDERIAAHMRFAAASGKAERLAAMLRSAAPHLTRSIDDWDADPWVLNVGNGTLELGEEVKFRGHDRADFVTRVAPVAFDSEAPAPLWHRFLDEVLPDREVQLFLQTWSGYCLTGSTREQRLVLLHGHGRNGKSTYYDAIMGILGTYAATLPIASLLHNDWRRGSEASPDFARLPGVRFVVSSEPKRTARLDEGLIKSLTGGDRITARHLHKDFFEFKPRFKLCLSFNARPVIRGQDEAIWQRIVLVPFDVYIPPEKRDGELGEKLKAEYPGILNWALDGLRLWRETGLVLPARVRDATADYRDDLDPIGQFLAVAIARKDGALVRLKDLYSAYCGWCRANAQNPISSSWFGRLLVDRGYARLKSEHIYYVGIELVRTFAEHQDKGPDGAPARNGHAPAERE